MMRLNERLLSSNVLLAPMAGVTDAAYRLICLAHGADLAYTEMVSVAGIHFRSAIPARPTPMTARFGSR